MPFPSPTHLQEEAANAHMVHRQTAAATEAQRRAPNGLATIHQPVLGQEKSWVQLQRQYLIIASSLPHHEKIWI